MNDDNTDDYLTEVDMFMIIEVLRCFEKSYNLDVKEGFVPNDYSEIISWSKRVRRIVARTIERSSAN